MRLQRALALVSILGVACASGFPRTLETPSGAWSAVCPERMDQVEPGAFCADARAFEDVPETRPICDYPEGYCTCVRRTDERPGWTWKCMVDPPEGPCPFARRSVPFDAGDACQDEGKTCTYVVDGCDRTYTCKQGGWREQTALPCLR